MYQELQALSIISLSSQDPISLLPYPNSPSSTPIQRLRTSKPRYTSYDTSNPHAITVSSTDVHQQFRLLDIIGYSDADFASDEDDRKSYTGYVFHCQRRRNNLVNSQTTHCRIFKHGIGIYGTI